MTGMKDKAAIITGGGSGLGEAAESPWHEGAAMRVTYTNVGNID